MRKSSDGGSTVAMSTAGCLGSGADFLFRLKVLEYDGTEGTSVSPPSGAFFRERKRFMMLGRLELLSARMRMIILWGNQHMVEIRFG